VKSRFRAGLLLAVLSCAPAAAAAEAAACRQDDVKYPAPDAAPITQVIYGDAKHKPLGADCFEHTDPQALWVTVASIIRTSATRQTFIARFGAISQLLPVQYWSVTEKKWRPLTSAAHATSSAQSTDVRADYSASELSDGAIRYYEFTDTRLGNAIRYSLRLRPSQADRVIVETTNVDPIKRWGITLYPPDSVHTLYYLDERSPGLWSYYSLTRVAAKSFLARGHEESFINRALAFYRHYMHLDTSAQPPPAH